MKPRRVIGFVIATAGVLLGAFLTVAVVALIISFWSAEPAGTGATRFAMIVLALFGALIAFGIYVAGRMIAR